jgi:hypothetical protein
MVDFDDFGWLFMVDFGWLFMIFGWLFMVDFGWLFLILLVVHGRQRGTERGREKILIKKSVNR